MKTLADRYRLGELIGEGGMGRVFRAQALATGRAVALKLLNPDVAGVEEVLQRFKREAKVTTGLSHPHIVKVIEFGEADGHLFLAMELLAGASLADLIKDRKDDERARRGGDPGLGVSRTVAIMGPVLAALAYAHRRGVVHRDLKPENVMVAPGRGLFSRESVKVLDFGIAKLGDEAQGSTKKLTQVGVTLGTPSYMSPEQAVGQPVDARSDVYSCGVMLYEMLTGRRPFEAELPVQVLSMHLNAEPKSLRAVAPEARIPGALEDVVLRALAKRPEDRFQSADDLRSALGRAAKAPFRPAVSGFAATVIAPSRSPKARPSRSSWMAPAIIVLSVGMLIASHALKGKAPGGPRRVASSEAGTARGREAPNAARSPAARERPRRAPVTPVAVGTSAAPTRRK